MRGPPSFHGRVCRLQKVIATHKAGLEGWKPRGREDGRTLLPSLWLNSSQKAQASSAADSLTPAAAASRASGRLAQLRKP